MNSVFTHCEFSLAGNTSQTQAVHNKFPTNKKNVPQTILVGTIKLEVRWEFRPCR